MYWETKKICVTHFIATFPLFLWSGSESTIASRSACITLQKTTTCVLFILPLLPSPLLAWWSQPLYCALAYGEARNRVRPLANSSWGTEGSVQQPRRKCLLPTISWVRLGHILPQSSLPLTAAPANTGIAACERRWKQKTHVSCTWIPDLQKLWDDKRCCFKPWSLGVIC